MWMNFFFEDQYEEMKTISPYCVAIPILKYMDQITNLTLFKDS